MHSPRCTSPTLGSLRIDDFSSTTPFGHVISHVVVLLKLEFMILINTTTAVWVYGKFLDVGVVIA